LHVIVSETMDGDSPLPAVEVQALVLIVFDPRVHRLPRHCRPQPVLPGLADLDRRPDHVTPLGPRAIVVLHVLVAEQILEHEPAVAGTLADPAIGDYRPVPRAALGTIQLLEFLA